ncbi:MAG: bifunctional metallophosphatase/5'-nucleotidase [Deltaproteobacteria bacterium]|nr:bifunctional metallophosphatase/5'-nucleotidase [Deltaproteobacteria bacterium]
MAGRFPRCTAPRSAARPRSIGRNPTTLSPRELQQLLESSDHYTRELTNGQNSRVVQIGRYVVKLWRPERRRDPLQASVLEVAAGMMAVRGHPQLEHVEFGYAAPDVALLVSRYCPNLCRIGDHPRGVALLDEPSVLPLLVSAMLFMDCRGVLHRDLCEWDIEFDRASGAPVVLDFDKLRRINWHGANLDRAQLALGFERDNSTLCPELLNIDHLLEAFGMEMCVFHHELRDGAPERGLALFARLLELQRDAYCPPLQECFRRIGRPDLAQAIRTRAERLDDWLDPRYSWRLPQLYMRKRLHFLTRAMQWSTEYVERRHMASLGDFQRRIFPLLAAEIERRRRAVDTALPLHCHPALAWCPAPAPIASTSSVGPSARPRVMPSRRVVVDLADPATLPPRPTGTHFRFAYMGDAHSKVARLARLGTVLDMLRTHGGVDAAFALGDNVEGGESVDRLWRTIELLNAMRLTASAIGNHEFDYHDHEYLRRGMQALQALFAQVMADYRTGQATAAEVQRVLQALTVQQTATAAAESVLAQAMRRAQFSWLCGNLQFAADSSLARLAADARILPGAVAELGDHLVLILGITTPDLAHELRYHARQGFDRSAAVMGGDLVGSVQRTIHAFKALYPERPVTTILLSHAGLPWDERLATPDIDLILGGHTHNLIHAVVSHGARSTHIVHAGQNALWLGVLDFALRADGSLQDVQHTLVDIDRSAIVPSGDYQPIVAEGTLPSAVLGTAVAPLAFEGKSARSTPLMNFITDAVQRQAGTDLSVNFGGNVRDGIPAGPVTEAALAEILPFDNPVHICSLTGAQVCALIKYAVAVSRLDSGTRPLLLHFAGLHYAVDRDGQVADVEIVRDRQRAPIDSEAVYTLSYPDFMETGLGEQFPLAQWARGDGADASRPAGFTVRKALRAAILRERSVTADPEPRIRIDPTAPVVYNSPTLTF